MTKDQKRIVVISGIFGVIVILLLLLTRKSPTSSSSPISLGGPTIDEYTLGPIENQGMGLPPGISLSVVMPTGNNAQGSCDCGCDNFDLTGTFNDLADYFVQNAKDLTQQYDSAILASVPENLLQYWNNPNGLLMSQKAVASLF